jgi:aconitate hydratase
MRTFDPEPRGSSAVGARAGIVASAETVAFAVATGEVGDPRAFKRPVRVTVPRALPTDDVLVTRKAERGEGAVKRSEPARAVLRREPPEAVPAWKAAQTLELVEGVALEAPPREANGRHAIAVLCATLDEVRDVTARAPDIAHAVRAVLAPYIPSGLVTLLSASGIAAIRVDAATAKKLEGQKTIALPAPSQWAEREATSVTVGAAKVPLTWLALGAERAWATGGGKGAAVAAPAAKAARS